MPATITTRAITIHMHRRRTDEPVQPFRERQVSREAKPVREELAAWIDSKRTQLGDAQPDMPNGITDRPAEIWEPLLAIADAAGGHWPHTAGDACRHFVLEAGPQTTSLGIRLLADLRDLFTHYDTDRLPTTVILADLRELDEAPWGDLDGKPLDPRRLARELNRYGARPQDLRMTGGVVKGYRADSPAGLADAWARDLPPPPAAATGATTATPQVSAVAATRPVADESATDLPAVTAATPCVADASATPRAPVTGLTRHVVDVADQTRKAR